MPYNHYEFLSTLLCSSYIYFNINIFHFISLMLNILTLKEKLKGVYEKMFINYIFHCVYHIM